jgi:hypothetical protein
MATREEILVAGWSTTFPGIPTMLPSRAPSAELRTLRSRRVLPARKIPLSQNSPVAKFPLLTEGRRDMLFSVTERNHEQTI